MQVTHSLRLGPSVVVTFVLIGIFQMGPNALAQDFLIHQFDNHPTTLNPALTGSADSFRIASAASYQYPKFSASGFTTMSGADGFVDSLSSGFGVAVTTDILGPLANRSFGVRYSYRATLGRDWWLQGGAGINLRQKTLDTDGLTFGDMIDPQAGFVYETQEDLSRFETPLSVLDLGVGVALIHPHLQAGVAWLHANRPNMGWDSPQPMSTVLNVHARGDWVVGCLGHTPIHFRPGAMHQRIEDTIQLSLVGSDVTAGWLLLGGWYAPKTSGASKGSWLPKAGVQIRGFQLSYLYRGSMGGLDREWAGGIHEISLCLSGAG